MAHQLDTIFDRAQVELFNDGLEKVNERTLQVALTGVLHQDHAEMKELLGARNGGGLKGAAKDKGPAAAVGGGFIAMVAMVWEFLKGAA